MLTLPLSRKDLRLPHQLCFSHPFAPVAPCVLKRPSLFLVHNKRYPRPGLEVSLESFV